MLYFSEQTSLDRTLSVYFHHWVKFFRPSTVYYKCILPDSQTTQQHLHISPNTRGNLTIMHSAQEVCGVENSN